MIIMEEILKDLKDIVYRYKEEFNGIIISKGVVNNDK